MPKDIDNPDSQRSMAFYRRSLINSSDSLNVEYGKSEIKIGCVPLFKESPTGLVQAVRVRVPASLAKKNLVLRVHRDSEVVAEERAEVTDGAQSVLLFVPEVSGIETMTLELTIDDQSAESVPFEVTPQRKWTLHLNHHSHYDIGYTDPQAEVMISQLEFIDYALDLCTATDDWPVDSQFKWNIEVNWPLREWLRTRPGFMKDQLIRRIEEGRIEVNALPFSMHTEAYSFDELAKQLDFAQELREEWGIPVVSAMQTDVPGATIGLSTLLTDAKVKYLSVAHNYAGRSIPHFTDGQDLTRPFYWQAPDGEKLLVWYTDTLNGIAYMETMVIGFASGYEDVLGSLPEYLNNLAAQPYPFASDGNWMVGNLADTELTKAPYQYDTLSMRLQGKFGDNASPSLLPFEIIKQWNETWAFPKLKSSVNHQFFGEIESKYGDQLETYRGDWTDWWADGIGSAAIQLGKNRESQSRIRTAQTLHSIGDQIEKHSLPDLKRSIDEAYQNMALFDEHTWGAANPWDQNLSEMSSGEVEWIRKAGFAHNAEEQTRVLLNGGLKRFSPIAVHESGATEAVVFNPSSHERTDLVTIFVPERELGHLPVEVIEVESGESVPFITSPQTNDHHRPIGVFITFSAPNVPEFGYSRFRIETSAAGIKASVDSPEKVSLDTHGISNDFFDVQINPYTGAIQNLLTEERDLVSPNSEFGFNAFVFDQYTSGTGWNHLSSRIGRSDSWLLGNRSTGSYARIVGASSNEVWDQVRIRYYGEGCDWIESTYTLPKNEPRLYIKNHLHKPSRLEKESLYFAFPFNLDSPDIHYHITGGVVQEGGEHVPGSANHFRTIRDWIAMSEDGAPGVALGIADAPLIQRGAIHLPYAPFAKSTPWDGSTIYSWALNNIWDTNFPPKQGGEMMFRYVVGSDSNSDPEALGTSAGDSANNPLVGVVAPLGSQGIPDMPNRGSFVSVEPSTVRVSHVIPSDGERGLQIVLVSESGDTVECDVTVQFFEYSTARQGTFWGTQLQDVERSNNVLRVQIASGELKSIILEK